MNKAGILKQEFEVTLINNSGFVRFIVSCKYSLVETSSTLLM